jgi:hypothetical protein
MAQPAYLTDQQVLGQEPETADLARQRRIAELLMTQGMEQPQGQMISGHYVAPSWTQQIAPLAKAAIGTGLSQSLDAKQAKLAEALRTKGEQEVNDIYELAKTDINAAAKKASSAQTPQGKALAATLMQNALPKKTDLIINYEAAKNDPVKPFKGSFDEWKNQLTEKDKADLALRQQEVGISGGRLALERDKAAQELMFGKPLPEGATKQVTGATNLKDAITNYKKTLEGFSTLDMANPNARANMGNAYNNMMLQAKEAYNLGVLNGPDYQILQSVVKDPTSPSAILVGKKTLEKQANDLSKQADVIIGNVFKTHNRPVPEALQPTPPTLPSTTGQQFPKIDPKLLEFMTPEQRKLFGG